MEAAAAAAVDGRGDEATRPAGGQPAEATEQPASPNAVEQAAAAEHKPGGAVTAAAARAGARAQGTSSGGSAPKRKPGRPALHQGCQVCGTPLEGMRSFHQRYHICEKHMMSDCVEWKGEPQRFCQQCGRFHPLDAFAPGMRSCRKQLAKHAERRRRGRELAAQAAAAAAAAAGGGKPGASTAAPAAKRPRSVALNAPEPATVGAARLLQPPSTWRISDSTGSGGSSGLHQSVPESGVDALLAAAEEDALAEAEGMDEDTGLLKQEPQQDAPPLRLEPDPAWFAGAATVPLPPPPLPAAATLGGLGPALPGAGAADAAMAAALAALGGGPAALAVAAAQQAQQAQLLTLLLAQQQQQQQRQRQSALAALLSTGLPVQPDSTALALALMQQSGQAAAVPPQATLLQQLLGGGAGGGAAALLQQAVAQQQVQQQVPPLLDDRQSIRERHVAVLYRAAVERLMQTVLQVAPQALALPGALAQLQAQPLTQNAQQPEPQQPTGQPAQQQQQQQSAPPVQQQQQQQQQEQQQRPAAASPVPHVIVVTPVPAQPLSPPQQGQPASQPVSPLAQHPQ